MILVLGVTAFTPSSASAQDAAGLVKAELLAEPASIAPGEPFTVGIRLSMKERWHTYWRNPGEFRRTDAGDLETAEQGFVAGELDWPAPSLIRVGPVASFGYEGDAMLLARVTAPRDMKPGTT